VLASAKAADDSQRHPTVVDGDHGVVSHGLASAAEIVDRLARAAATRLDAHRTAALVESNVARGVTGR